MFAGLVLKEKCMTLPTRGRLLCLQRGSWNYFMWWWEEIFLGHCRWLLKIYMGLFLQTKEWDSTNCHWLCQWSSTSTQCPYLGNKKWQRLRIQELHFEWVSKRRGDKTSISVVYTPQQNGVAERKNRTLMDMARSMLAEFKSPYNFWAEAISTACHSSNRIYLRKILDKTQGIRL